MARILDANDQERIGNRLVGGIEWDVVGPFTDADDPVSAAAGQLVLVGELDDDLAVDLAASPADGSTIGVVLLADPDGNTVTVSPVGTTLTASGQFYVFAYAAADGAGWFVQSASATSGFPDIAAVLAAGNEAGTAEIIFEPDSPGDPVIDAGGGTIDNFALGGGTTIVTSQGDPPGADFITPLVYDDSAVTGGCYAWDGSAYVQISNVVA